MSDKKNEVEKYKKISLVLKSSFLIVFIIAMKSGASIFDRVIFVLVSDYPTICSVIPRKAFQFEDYPDFLSSPSAFGHFTNHPPLFFFKHEQLLRISLTLYVQIYIHPSVSLSWNLQIVQEHEL